MVVADCNMKLPPGLLLRHTNVHKHCLPSLGDVSESEQVLATLAEQTATTDNEERQKKRATTRVAELMMCGSDLLR